MTSALALAPAPRPGEPVPVTDTVLEFLERFDDIDRQLRVFDKLTSIVAKLEQIAGTAALTAITEQMDGFSSRLDSIAHRVDALEKRQRTPFPVTVIENRSVSDETRAQLTDMSRRIAAIEAQLGVTVK
jgi:hypothetical protein